jgi:hypothetical protein
MFNVENGSELKTVPDASEFLGSALDIRGDDSVLLYCPEEGRFLADGFIAESRNSFGYALSINSCLMFLINC